MELSDELTKLQHPLINADGNEQIQLEYVMVITKVNRT